MLTGLFLSYEVPFGMRAVHVPQGFQYQYCGTRKCQQEALYDAWKLLEIVLDRRAASPARQRPTPRCIPAEQERWRSKTERREDSRLHVRRMDCMVNAELGKNHLGQEGLSQ